MFKRLLKSRHDAPPSKDGGASLLRHTKPNNNGGLTRGPSTCSPAYSLNPVEYDLESPHFSRDLSEQSVNPVDYRRDMSGQSVNPVKYQYNPTGPIPFGRPPTSVKPAEYRQSPLSPDVSGASTYGHASSTESPIPIDYRASAPMPTPKQPAQPQVVENTQRRAPQSPTATRYTYTVDHPPPRLDRHTKHAYFTSLAEQNPVELPASAVPARYELPAVSTPRQTPLPPYSPPRHARPSTRPGQASPTASSTTTLVPSPRSELPSPRLGHTKANNIPSPTADGNDGIKKFVVDIYCPLKRDAHGNCREQVPRDVREFRLSKVALIPIVAGKRTFVSFDVVFGEVDKPYADIVEKHFSCSHLTRLTEIEPETVYGGQVFTVGPLNIAYRDGESSMVYVRFLTKEDNANINVEQQIRSYETPRHM
ncbi:hypothetical protein CC86DRAFT_384088 [Ophiobolus disseminans]|uniref:Uncharacterized protein n=1 Tax=Ophiobolus disseminans TaxID=1469910 RepID=A0A6A6ZTR9_9PLEO|nr:hypothetical protein CC86DRAFT_384088 [Ophiobolus disseminans]